MIRDETIFQAFAVLLTTFGQQTSPATPVAYPGINFTPPSTGEWIELSWFPNETLNYGIPNDGPSIHRGFVQAMAYTRPGAGVVGVTQLASAIISTYAKGLEVGGATIERKPWMSSVIQEGDKIMVPVTIPYRAASDSETEFALFLYGGNASTEYTSAVEFAGGGA
jgi:hypothetical protein